MPTALPHPPDPALVDALAQTSFATMGLLTRIGAGRDLSLTQLRVLAILRDRRLRMSDLASYLGLDKSTLTGLVDRAARRGLVDRAPNPVDRRAVDVSLSATGLALAEQVAGEVADRLQPLTGRLTPVEQGRLGVGLRRLLGEDAAGPAAVAAPDVSAGDRRWLARSIQLAAAARAHGNHPFGALLVTAAGDVVEAENTVLTDADPTCHAETNLVRLVARRFAVDALRTASLYTSTEPCAMCAGAVYWAGIGRVVYALPEQELGRIASATSDEPTLDLPCREVFARGGDTVRVAGPALLAEAAAVHEGFWS